MSNDTNDDFWGSGRDWPTGATPRVALGDEHPPTGRVRNWWANATTSSIPVTRVHRHHDLAESNPDEVPPLAIQPFDFELNDDDRAAVGDGAEDDIAYDEHVSDGGSHAHRIDPLLARIGAAVVVATLLVPLAIGAGRGTDGDTLVSAARDIGTTLALDETTQVAETTTSTADVAAGSAAEPSIDVGQNDVEQSTTLAEGPATPSVSAEPSSDLARTSSALEVASNPSGNEVVSPAVAEAPADRVEPVCPIEYEVVSGDYWIRLADESGVEIDELFDVNGSTMRTPLYPGEVICLPEGASIPDPPSTTTPTTEPSTPAPTTPKPVTTEAPSTTTPQAPTTPVSASRAEQIIREVWPDELENRAVEIAQRESNLIPTAKNFCCYGLFQIYFTVHKGWLDDIGVTSGQQLFDPETNARAALTLYMRAGGFGPWGG